MRHETVVIYDKTKEMFHFTDPTLSGYPFQVWYPGSATLQNDIEAVLEFHKMAHNVVGMEHIRRCGDHIDYRVVYNT